MLHHSGFAAAKDDGRDIVYDWILRYIGLIYHLHPAPITTPPPVYRQSVLQAVCSAYRPSTSVKTGTPWRLQFPCENIAYFHREFEFPTFHCLRPHLLDLCLMAASGTEATDHFLQFCLDPTPPSYFSCSWTLLSPVSSSLLQVYLGRPVLQ